MYFYFIFIFYFFVFFYFIFFFVFFFLYFFLYFFFFGETSQYLALFTDPVTDLAQKVWTLPIFQHFSSDFLSFNMTDLADNETTIYTTHKPRAVSDRLNPLYLGTMCLCLH